MRQGRFRSGAAAAGHATAYQAEVDFYAELAPSLSIPTARCWYAGGNPAQQQGILIFDDLSATGHTFGEPTRPFTVDQVAAGLEILAGLHAATAKADRPTYPWGAFRDFEMPQDLQDGYGYPDITPEMKRDILGLNMARLHGLDVETIKAETAADEWARRREAGKQPPWAVRRAEAANLPV